MFTDCSLLVLLETKDDSLSINRVELDRDTQILVCGMFSEVSIKLTAGKQRIKFNGIPSHDEDEYLVIENYEMSNSIKESIRNQLGVDPYIPNDNAFSPIKAVFIGCYNQDEDNYLISFQRFRKEQYICRNGISIFHEKNTFSQEKRFGIVISDTVDCIFSGTDLIFDSYYFARQIFDLSKYYREATDADVANFVGHPNIATENTELFKSQADSVLRRKIASIIDSGILDKYSASQIKAKAKSMGLDLSVKNKQLHLPSEKPALKTILKFLDEEIYKGPFSDDLFQAHSKRRVEL